jgi:hypothetical protein
MCANPDASDRSGHGDFEERSRKGLFIHMGVSQHAGPEDFARLAQYLEAIGVMVPARVCVSNGDVEAADAAGVAIRLGRDHIGDAGTGDRRHRNRKQGGKTDRAAHPIRPIAHRIAHPE